MSSDDNKCQADINYTTPYGNTFTAATQHLTLAVVKTNKFFKEELFGSKNHTAISVSLKMVHEYVASILFYCFTRHCAVRGLFS